MAKDRRKDIRNTFITTVIYSVVNSEESLQPVEPQQGITLNVSESGACLYVFREVSEGQMVELFTSFISENCIRAVVRWVEKVTDNIYKVGLMCQV